MTNGLSQTTISEERSITINNVVEETTLAIIDILNKLDDIRLFMFDGGKGCPDDIAGGGSLRERLVEQRKLVAEINASVEEIKKNLA